VTRLRYLLPLTNAAVFAVVGIAFVAQHGGWRGEVSFEDGISDVVTGDDGLVVLNRWRLVSDRESPLTKAFIIVNAPAFGAAKLLMGALESVSGTFQGPSPFGLSYPSYTIAFGLLLSLLQWFGLGLGLETVRGWVHRPSRSTG